MWCIKKGFTKANGPSKIDTRNLRRCRWARPAVSFVENDRDPESYSPAPCTSAKSRGAWALARSWHTRARAASGGAAINRRGAAAIVRGHMTRVCVISALTQAPRTISPDENNVTDKLRRGQLTYKRAARDPTDTRSSRKRSDCDLEEYYFSCGSSSSCVMRGLQTCVGWWGRLPDGRTDRLWSWFWDLGDMENSSGTVDWRSAGGSGPFLFYFVTRRLITGILNQKVWIWE